MDGRTFDQLTKALVTSAPRRQVLRGLAGALAGAAAAAFGGRRAGALQNCRAFGQTCRSQGAGNQCCSGLVCTGDPGTCVECRTVADCPTVQLGPCEARTCGNGRCGVGPAPAGTVCRAAAGPCDVAEVCTGSSTACPSNAFAPAGTVCRAATDACEGPALCTGNAAACPNNPPLPAGTVCRAGVGGCDVAEVCTGSSAACPPDVTEPCPGNTICCRVGRHAGQCVAAPACTARG